MAWDQHEARRITGAAEEYLREHQPPGYLPTPEENKAFQELLTRRSVANYPGGHGGVARGEHRLGGKAP